MTAVPPRPSPGRLGRRGGDAGRPAGPPVGVLRLHRQHLPVADGRRRPQPTGRGPPPRPTVRCSGTVWSSAAPAPVAGTPASPSTVGPAPPSGGAVTPIGGTGPRPSTRPGSPRPIWWCASTAATNRPSSGGPGAGSATTATRSAWCCCAPSTDGPAADVDVPDPYYGDDADFEHCLDLVEAGCRGLVPTWPDGWVRTRAKVTKDWRS